MSDQISQLPEDCPPLVSFYIYLTGGCNLACKHCWIAPSFQPDGGTGGHLPFELFELAIEEALPLGLQNIMLTGGEPTLHPDFERMVDHIAEQGVGLTIETNGILLTKRLAERIKEVPTFGFISVSLDGADAETHDAFRGVDGA
ncbi:MAG: radical SAM protein, partial [Anaerolineae bacterium]|nr:radical SAM protein [Anaerolineae bacterium]